MEARLERWAEGAGLLIWAAVGMPVIAGSLTVAPSGWWWVGYLAYGVVLVIAVVIRRPGMSSWLTGMQLPLGLATFVLDGGYGFSSVLLIVNAAAAALVWRARWVVLVVAGQTVAVAVTGFVRDHDPTDLLPLAEAAL